MRVISCPTTDRLAELKPSDDGVPRTGQKLVTGAGQP
jgi:hypothetical protein